MSHESGPSVHASVVQFNQGAVMLMGPSGSGKSTLALALIRQKNAHLVADDRALLQIDAEQNLCATAPENIAGLIEVRGMGLLRIGTEGAARAPAIIRLAVELVARKMYRACRHKFICRHKMTCSTSQYRYYVYTLLTLRRLTLLCWRWPL